MCAYVVYIYIYREREIDIERNREREREVIDATRSDATSAERRSAQNAAD